MKKKIPLHIQIRQTAKKILKERLHGKAIFSDFTQSELPEHLISFAIAFKEMAIFSLILWLIFHHLSLHSSTIYFFLFTFGISFLLWKSFHSAYIGWRRLKKLHRVIEEERWEIEHHRPQERKELETLYQAKGFSGKLLDEVVDILMADDNRLLQIMLEEEMGLSLGSYEHPLKQGAGSALGVISASLLLIFFLYFFPFYGIYFSCATAMGLASILSAWYEKNKILTSLIWNLSLALAVAFFTYFILDFMR